MMKVFISGALVASIFFAIACKQNTDKKVLTKEVVFTKEGELQLKKASNDSLLAKLDIEIADDGYQTETGLMYRKSMEPNQAMLFIFENEQPRAFYMKNTEFPLDIIFINSSEKVVSIQKNAKPRDITSLPSEGPTLYVLEVNAGLTDLWRLESGDKIEWTSDN
jgi:uncharacterized membrane protein (UPF0127 family)